MVIFLNIRYLEKETSVLTECFTILYYWWHILFDKISIRKAFIQFFYKFLALGRKWRFNFKLSF